MKDQHLLIIGGGLAGLSAGCYALRAGYRTTIVEHNLSLGGVCTGWQRGDYTIDGCIHWLTGGPFQKVYEELKILPTVQLRTLDSWITYRSAGDGFELPFTRDLDHVFSNLREVAPEDAQELDRMLLGCRAMVQMEPNLAPQELVSFKEMLKSIWDMRGAVGSLVHFRKPVDVWTREHLKNDRLRRVFGKLVPGSAPTFFLLLVLGYLEQGYLSRPVGGSMAFRDALVNTYQSLGGQALMHSTVDEVVIEEDRAAGLRLADGSMLSGDVVLSTASSPETILRLLGGRYGGNDMRRELDEFPLFDPIVLASFGVAKDYADAPSLLQLDQLEPFEIGGRSTTGLLVRSRNDDPCFAPPGHTVVQAIAATDYNWWATRGTKYTAEKEAVADCLRQQLEPYFPGLDANVKSVDVATPLTYWNMARSWRGAYEGWLPRAEGFFSQVNKRVPGLDGLYLAGQWVEPGGGVPTAILSGRQAVQLICDDDGRAFGATA